jgi:hypothetical protein
VTLRGWGAELLGKLQAPDLGQWASR